MENKVMSAQIKGLIIGLVLIVISVVSQVLGGDISKMRDYAWISYLILMGAIVWACFSYSHDMSGNVTFGSIFSHGFKTTAVMTILVLAYSILAFTVVFPDMKEKALEAARQQMESQGKLNDDQIEQALTMTRKFFIPFSIGGILIGYLFLGAIGSLIGAFIAKKNPNPVFPDQLGN